MGAWLARNIVRRFIMPSSWKKEKIWRGTGPKGSSSRPGKGAMATRSARPKRPG